MTPQTRYLSYLLRLWQENAGDLPGGDLPLWRASLERPQDGERLGFASLEDLYAYLDAQTGSSSLRSECSNEGVCRSGAKLG